METIFSRTVRIRRAAQRGKEVSIPPNTEMEVGADVVQIYNDQFVLIVPPGTIVDGAKLRQFMQQLIR